MEKCPHTVQKFPASNLKMPVGMIKFLHYLIKFLQVSNICMQIQTNARKYAQKVEKCQQTTISIDEVKWRNKISTICLQKLDEVKCINKYLEMNRPTRFQGKQLVYILIGGAIWLDKENKINWSSIVMLSLMHAYLLWTYYMIVDTFIMRACPYKSRAFQW